MVMGYSVNSDDAHIPDAYRRGTDKAPLRLLVIPHLALILIPGSTAPCLAANRAAGRTWPNTVGSAGQIHLENAVVTMSATAITIAPR